MKSIPANAISGRSGGGNEEETFAAAKNVNLFLNICVRQLAPVLVINKQQKSQQFLVNMKLCMFNAEDSMFIRPFFIPVIFVS